jgi:hypothetical protein
LNKKLRPGLEKKDRSDREGRSRKRFDDTVAMKRERSSMLVGTTESGYCDGAFDVAAVSL